MLCGRMKCRLLTALLTLAGAAAGLGASSYHELDQPPHDYWHRPLKDPFTRLTAELEAGRVTLETGSEKAFLISLLRALKIPASSQALVFSTTSLQLRLITPSNPRALYFNEDVYLGYIPGGKIEIVSLDPDLGGIFYIFDIPKAAGPLRVERSDRCMNCHAAAETGQVPGLVMKSVVPGPTGGSLMAFRLEQTGHGIPFDQRFGGWYVTGRHGITNHWGNLIGRLSPDGLTKIPVPPGTRFDFARYPMATSDVLTHLLLEHQAGFVNRVVEAAYRTRALLHEGGGQLGAAQAGELDDQAHLLVRYLLFAEEAALPPGGIEGDALFKAAFVQNRRKGGDGASLKDFDLRTRLFKHRCSYMIYSSVFQGLPTEMKQRVYRRLGEALNLNPADAEFAYLPAAEKRAIRSLLQSTLTDLPAGW
jgi:hypothetical protein